MIKSIFLLSCLGAPCFADLRMASQTKDHGNKKAWEVQQRNRNVPFVTKYALYMEPSDFNYAGLKQQRDGGGYDNFLRSNIDNEQDRRNFNTEEGKDHLPFRSYETAARDVDSGITVKHKMVAGSAAGDHWEITPGEPFDVPLRWNNPHSSEIEVNIWIMNKDGGPHVVPVMKPSCSGEGYQDNAFTFTIPTNFVDVASCEKIGECVAQIYAHSVESRMYSMGTPVIIKGSKGAWNAANVQNAPQDTALDLHKLHRLCLPSGSNTQTHANYEKAVVYKARLSSDVYNHAYQNSDFSPYAGQQPLHISQNLQAACILKMTVGNFGELGKSYVPKRAKQHAKKLDKKARNLIRVYETTTNAIIEAIKEDTKNQVKLEFNKPGPNMVECTEWRDQYNKNKEGRLRGADRTGGYCPTTKTCYCNGDCYFGHGPGDAQKDAVCVEIEPTEDGKGLQKKAGTESDRVGRAAQRTETCFRCAEVGSTKVQRQNTNTYIPSFEIRGATAEGDSLVRKALRYVPPAQLESGFLTDPDTGKISTKDDDAAILQIYMAVLTDMWPEFKEASTGEYMQKYYPNHKIKEGTFDMYKLHYRGPVLKDTTDTLKDATQFLKVDADGNNDKGKYASKMAWPKQAIDNDIPSAHAIPGRDGPLQSSNLIKSNNMGGGTYDNSVSPSGDMKIAYHVKNDVVMYMESDTLEECQMTLAKMSGLTSEITEENEDMDALNRDADCDDDSVVEAQMEKYNKECDEQQLAELEKGNKDFQCEPFEVQCYIPGEDSQLPTQMFMAEGAKPLWGGQQGASAASTLSAVSGMVLLLQAFL